ncbi:hypothetical protein A1O3_04696 [Capronia epimyces CBS 606.96]|uniref:Alpha/beta hydrolase fold-3 domain-containing protein n=1 Tax=Capronia epimyces CBS 606.96 TaxID=1182542 RepID=W9YP39_9EURO|nr:uncharacterized protein A1O3_04696 [Capronia epimyces CBS 606.96]EXJ84029.1 hypothetical protein A1O3_04696 [Capronia epimyces CBS 606.96]
MPLSVDPDFQTAWGPIASAMASVPKVAVHDVATKRARFDAAMPAFVSLIPDSPDVETAVFQVDSYDGAKISVHGFTKKSVDALSPGPAILHVHGGGMIVGSVGSFERTLAIEVQQTGIPLYSVEYRLAPEAKDTSLVQDCYAALVWLGQNAKQLNIDPTRIAILGESAGGGIAAGVALMARDQNLQPPLAKQILTYPMLDDRNLTPNPALAQLASWTYDDNITGWTALLGEKAGNLNADVSYYAAPARAKSLAGLPPTFIYVGELDIFRDEDIAYAQRLAAENISVEFHLFPGVPHAFELYCPDTRTAKTALELRRRALQSF